MDDVRRREPFKLWLLKGEALVKAKEDCPLNVCFILAINNMVGAVLFDTVIEFLRF